MEVTYELTPDDLWQYSRYYRRHKGHFPSILLDSLIVKLGLGLFVLLMLAVSGILLTSFLQHSRTEWELLSGPAGLLFLLPFLPPSKKRLIKKAAKQPGVFCEHTHGISPEWTAHKTPVYDSKMAWTTVHSVEEDESCIYLFLTKNAAYVVPKRAFDSSSEAQVFFDRSRRYQEAAKNGTAVGEEAGVWPPAPRPGV